MYLVNHKGQKRRTELSQSIARMVVCAVVLVYMVISYSFGEQFPRQQLVIWVLVAYAIYSVGLYVAIKLYPRPMVWRRGLGIISDLAVTSFGFNIAGSFGGVFYPLYLWIIVGNGLRFGVSYLLFAMGVGVVALSIAVFNSSYWIEHLALAVGLLIGIVVLPMFYVVILRELEAANLDLQTQIVAAKQAHIAKARFLAAASHDLRQPLQAQALFIADLYERLHDPQQSLAIVKKLDDSVNAMRMQFNSLLDISRLDAGAVYPRISNFKIKKLLSLLDDEYAQQAKAKGLKFRVRSRDVTVRTDPGLLDSVLRNLVVNAIRYTSSGKVFVGCRLCSDHVSIQVWDTGSGIKNEHLDDIFQEFFQIDNPERNRDQGLGLGLSVVRRVASLLDCSVHVKSTFGKGSCFCIDVPLGDEKSISPKSNVSSINKKHLLSGVRVIVIDDDNAILDAMEGMLKSWGCSVLVAETGETMLPKMIESSFSPDIIIADYRLPGNMTGAQAVSAIRTHLKREVPAILITGDIEIEKFQDVKNGVLACLHKPIQPVRLRTLMHHLTSVS